MLAPCFKTADELGLNPTQRDALIKVLGMLERGELYEIQYCEGSISSAADPKAFSMRGWGTCICGHAKRFSEWDSAVTSQSGPTGNLFYRTGMNMAQATMALRDYLTTGGVSRSIYAASSE
jgi:hypothetical protein